MTYRRSPAYTRDLLPPDLYPSALDDATRVALWIVALALAGLGILGVLWSIWLFISWVLGS